MNNELNVVVLTEDDNTSKTRRNEQQQQNKITDSFSRVAFDINFTCKRKPFIWMNFTTTLLVPSMHKTKPPQPPSGQVMAHITITYLDFVSSCHQINNRHLILSLSLFLSPSHTLFHKVFFLQDFFFLYSVLLPPTKFHQLLATNKRVGNIRQVIDYRIYESEKPSTTNNNNKVWTQL